MKASILAASLLLAISGAASAATITPINVDPAGAGLNDPTPRAPVGLNPGKSVGEQRRLVYQFAADIWGAVLKSNVEVRVGASFAPLSCMATSGVLGSAGATQIFRDFDGAQLPGTWYHSALADAIAGVELDDTADIDINSRFNANLGTPGCLETSSWYYGLDGNTPTGAINFLDVVLHEIGHGLGFQGFSNVSTGALFNGFPDVYGANVFDNVSGSAFNSLTDTGRQAAIIGGNIVWTGAAVTSQVPAALAPLVRLNVTGSLTAQYDYGTAGFGAPATAANFSGMTAVVEGMDADPATMDTPSQGCGPLTNASAVSGKIALVDRGTCAFTVKAKNAQNAGAIGVIVVNNAAGAAPGLGGADATVTVPTISLSQADGTALKTASPASVSLASVPGRFFGSDANGRALLFSPNPVQPGSSFSHYDVSATPNALQEPSINADLDGNVRLDLSPALYADEGWLLNTGTATTHKGKCDTGVPVLTTPTRPGLVGGANLQAADALCRRQGASRVGVRSCMAPFLTNLRSLNAIPADAEPKVRICTL